MPKNSFKIKIEKTKLPGGGTILGVNLPDYNSVTINFGFKTGSRAEPDDLAGISHFLEHMLFKGSAKRPAPEIIAREADSIGAIYNAMTGKEFTCYYIKTDKAQFDTALDLVGDMITTPKLDQKELDKERGTIIEEIKMINDSPQVAIFDLMEETLYGATTLGRDIAGSEKTVRNIQSNAMRDYYTEHYNRQNLAVAVVGDLPDNYVDLVSQYIRRVPKGRPTAWPIVSPASIKLAIDNRKLNQSNLGLMIPGVSITDSNRQPLRVAATILGGYMSSRLFTEIREKRGWAYRIQAFTEDFTDSGYLGIYGGVKKDKTKESLALIKKILLEFADTVTEEEVKRAIGNVKGQSTIKYESTDKIANEVLLHYLLAGELYTPQDEAEEIGKVTLADVKRVAQKHFAKDKIYLALIGPFQNKEEFVKILAE